MSESRSAVWATDVGAIAAMKIVRDTRSVRSALRRSGKTKGRALSARPASILFLRKLVKTDKSLCRDVLAENLVHPGGHFGVCYYFVGSSGFGRFHLVFQNFVRVFTQPEHPLVIFIDDLQWADSGSLKLLQVLLTAFDVGHLYVIGA